MNKRALAIALILLASSIIVAGILLGDLGKDDASNSKLYTYPLSVGNKTFIVTVEANWTAEREPSVSLLNSSEPNQYAIELYFRGHTDKNVNWETITYNIAIPDDLLWGDISLVWKYYTQDPDRYTLSNNSTHNSLQMTFDYSPFFSGSGYFIIEGTD